MKRSQIIPCLVLMLTAVAYASGQPEPAPIQAEPVMAAEELDTGSPAVINIVETYPDENIYNAIGRNTVKSGQPDAIFTVFNELRRTYDPIIINWVFLPLGGSMADAAATDAITQTVNQELINYSRDHIGLTDRYEILETYDETMASIIIVVEVAENTTEITPKVSMTSYNFNYKLVTPTDQIVIGKSSATIVKENFHDKANMRVGEKVLVDVWY